MKTFQIRPSRPSRTSTHPKKGTPFRSLRVYADVRADWGVTGGSSPSAHRGVWPCRSTLPSRTGSCGPDRERWKRRLAKDVQNEKLRRGATLVHHSVDHLIEMVVLRQVRRMPGLRAT